MVGSTLLLDARPHEIIGVLPEQFWFPGNPGVVVPYAWSPEQEQNRGSRWMEGIGRLAPGATLEQADAELKRLFAGLERAYPQENADWSVWTAPFGQWALGSNRPSLLLLNGSVLLLLLIAAVNVANLMLVRAERRAQDTAVRVALGATGAQIARRQLAEGLWLGIVGAIAGVAISLGATGALLRVYGGNLPRMHDIALSLPVLSYAGVLALGAGLLVGAVPLLRMRTMDVLGALKEGGRGGGARRSRLQRILVGGEVAVAVLLVSGAGLLIHSFRHLNAVDPGIEIENALVFTVQLPEVVYDSPESTGRFFEHALERIREVPGVRLAGVSEVTPLQGGYNITTLPSPDDPEVSASFVEIRTVTPDFFAAAGIPLLAGRGLDENDVREGRDVVVISDVLAEAIFGDGDPLGRTILSGWDGGFEIVGVVGSVREFGLTQGRRPAVYWPLQKLGQRNSMVFVVRTTGEPMRTMPGIRAAIAALDPELPLYAVRTMGDVATETVGARWFATRLFTVFGSMALVLAAIGIFGVLAYVVEQRTREIGIRMALGASTSRVRRMVVGQGLRLVAWGLLAGLVAALFASRLLSDLLWEVEPTDPSTLGSVALVVLVTALLAAWLPALRATRIAPGAALARD